MFNKKNTQKFVVVHRDHDDPNYYNDDETEHIMVPVDDLNQKRKSNNIKKPSNITAAIGSAKTTDNKSTSGYDYSQHLRPIGVNKDAFFIPSKASNSNNKQKYLAHQQNIVDEIKGFQPDLNPDLREILEALDDDAYVVNEDIVVKSKKNVKNNSKNNDEQNEIEQFDEGDDDIFAELLEGGEMDGNINDFDEWDIDEQLNNYEDEEYNNIVDNVNNWDDLKEIDYQDDVKRFQKFDKQDDLSDNEFLEDDLSDSKAEFMNHDFDEEEENDVLGDLPTISNKNATGKQKRRQRKKKGTMSDISGFSMSSSAIARTETMTILDDKYDQIIQSYENYEEEAEEEEEEYQPFDMSKERSDLESMLDDFLDNYELEQGGRKLAKKDDEIQRYKDAADSVTKGKLSMQRNRQKKAAKNGKNVNVNNITNSLSSLKF